MIWSCRILNLAPAELGGHGTLMHMKARHAVAGATSMGPGKTLAKIALILMNVVTEFYLAENALVSPGLNIEIAVYYWLNSWTKNEPHCTS